MKRVLVTGASGFIGRHAVLALRQQTRGDETEIHTEIHTVQHTARQMSDSRSHTVDLMDAKQVDRLMERVKPTHLLHLAWYAEHGKFWTSPLNLSWVSASLHLFQSFAEQGGSRAVFAGTCAEYDWTNPVNLAEDASSSPSTLYGVCKNSLRQIVERFAEQASISLAWGRIFFLYGRGEHPNRLIPSILQPLLNDQPANVRSGAHVRNLMHVEDVAAAFVSILNSDVTGIVNIAGGKAVSLGDVARLLGEMTGKSALLRIEQAAGTKENPLMLTADVSKLTALGFREKYSLQSGLATLLDAREPA